MRAMKFGPGRIAKPQGAGKHSAMFSLRLDAETEAAIEALTQAQGWPDERRAAVRRALQEAAVRAARDAYDAALARIQKRREREAR